MPRRRRERLHFQAGEHGRTAVSLANLAISMSSLPIQRSRSDTGASDAEPRPELDSAAINILIVDDDAKNLTVLETVLADSSYRLVRATSADEALLALIDREFALLILDIRLPGMTGCELAQMVKNRQKTAHVPSIFLTAYYHE